MPKGFMDDLIWLNQWFKEQCNGYWEHDSGIKIATLDNPGWLININIENTDLENINFIPISMDRTEDDWIRCFVKLRKFEAYGGIFNLNEMLKIFREWAESNTSA